MVAQQRLVGGRGGSAQTVLGRKRTKTTNPTAFQRACNSLGADVVEQIQTTYKKLNSKWGGTEHDHADGMIISLMQQGLPHLQVRAVFGVGGSRITRLKSIIDNGMETSHTQRPRLPPWHALAAVDTDFMKADAESWALEDGFPCQHRRPRQYFTEPKLTWTKVWLRYKENWKKNYAGPKKKPISYTRYTQYAHFFFPGVRLTRTAEDLCDACVRIDIALLDTSLSDDDRNQLEKERALHLDAAIAQRRAVTTFVKSYAKDHAPTQILPEEIIATDPEAEAPETDASSESRNQNQPPMLQIQIEDFGGSLSLPFYGSARPAVDYFNSNLSLHNFVIADITNNVNNVMLYDERGQGKGADALCSLRLDYHLQLRKRFIESGIPAPEKTAVLLLILDNCVGQNKSKQVFNFFAMLSVVFYKKVAVLYLIPGHSHNAADRVVAWCKNKMNGENLYCPEEIATRLNEIASVQARFFDHRSPSRPFFSGWSNLLSKYFGGMPAGYTGNYFFELDFGTVRMRHLVDSPEQAPLSLIGNGNSDTVRQAFIEDMFGAKSIDVATMGDVLLERTQLIPLSLKKRKSLALKYISIPAIYQSYFPAESDDTAVESDTAVSQDVVRSDQQTNKRPKTAPGVEPPKPRLGRPPKNALAHTHSHPSILKHFKPVARDP